MPESDFLLAIDGGGSKTKAWIASTDRAEIDASQFVVLGSGEAGPGNPRAVGFDQACCNIANAVSHARQHAKIPADALDAACISLAGAGRQVERDRVLAWAQAQRFARSCIVTDDGEPLAYAACYEQGVEKSMSAWAVWANSISVVVGTGSILRGIRQDATSARVGGWGFLLGDEGSGYSLGLKALQSICQAHDHQSVLSPMQMALLSILHITDPTQLVGWIYRDPLPRAEIAALAEVVFEFDQSDAIATHIVDGAVLSLVEGIACLGKRLGFLHHAYALAMSGGILKHQPRLVARLLDELHRSNFAPSASHVIEEPLYGGLVLAQRIARSRRTH